MLHLIFLIVEIKVFGNVNHHFVKHLNAAIVSLSFRGWHVYTLRINYLSQITINVDKNFTHNYWFQKNHYDYNNLFLFWCVLCDLYTDICCIQCIGQSVDPLPKNLFLENHLYNYAGYPISMYWVYLSVSHRYMYFTTYYRQMPRSGPFVYYVHPLTRTIFS